LSTKIENFAEAALPHLNTVYRAAYALCGESHVAEDLTQTTFVKALERFGTFKSGTNCKAWLYQILRHTWIDELRHRKVVGPVLPITESDIVTKQSEPDTTWTNAKDLLENFSDEQIIKALHQLPEDQRLTLYLIDVEQMSLAEIAQITDVAIGTVKSRSSRARAALKKKLQAYANKMGFTENLK
jgi:RNA polymerase sigma-70 factor (ECF subfamily)